ncbi:MAG: adenylate/guanylate cyclase domain-containing protein [Rhodospirillales bacterium]|nr:adenylate/guanylate cyclase domain-containing protein [Alphaproteobacteria bacterium]USO02846.1 MAG: adenylate/guanylate cyclase domain-containing protein [Rhodospirillales bacterium]
MIKFLTNKWIHILILFGLLGAGVYFSGSSHELRKRLQYATFDSFNRLHPRPPSGDVVIIDLDEESLKVMGQWPWPRSVIADMVGTLKELGAKVIAFDIVFAEKDRTSPALVAATLPEEGYDDIRQRLKELPDNDEIFAQAIREAGNVVTGFTRARPEETLRRPFQTGKPTFLMKDKTPFFRDGFSVPGVATNLPEFSSSAAGNGSFMATPDVDGIIREVSLLVRYPPENTKGIEPELYPMLGIEALRVYINKKARLVLRQRKDKTALDTNYLIKIAGLDVPIESDSKLWVYYRDIAQEEYISAQRLFNPAEKERLRERLKDKIVFVGTSAEGLRDIRSTPLDIFVPGVEVHVNIVEQILQGKYLKRPDIIVGVEALIIGLAGFLIIVLAPFINVIWLALFTAILMGGMFLGSWEAYTRMGILLDPVYPSAALSVLFLVSSLLSYIRSESERRQVRQAFGLYISPSFMEELTKNPDKLKLGGEVRDLTVMFTDIRRFTSISENLTPEELIHLMNDFLTPMSDTVMENRGTIDKYMGDAMMAFWNAPLDDKDHARHACISALKMKEALGPINRKLEARAEEEGREALLLSAGIGINTGPCSVGNMGSRQRFAYSALGDAVNLASRLEGQTKTYGVDILVGEDTRNVVQEMAFIELDLLKVKGRENALKVFTLLGDESFAGEDGFRRWETLHNGMLAAYRAGDFDCAAQDLKEARAAADGQLSFYYDLYMERIVDLVKNPPQAPWDGVFEAKSK